MVDFLVVGTTTVEKMKKVKKDMRKRIREGKAAGMK